MAVDQAVHQLLGDDVFVVPPQYAQAAIHALDTGCIEDVDESEIKSALADLVAWSSGRRIASIGGAYSISLPISRTRCWTRSGSSNAGSLSASMTDRHARFGREAETQLFDKSEVNDRLVGWGLIGRTGKPKAAGVGVPAKRL